MSSGPRVLLARSIRRALLCVSTGLLALGSLEAQELMIVEPAEAVPVFDQVEVVVDWTGVDRTGADRSGIDASTRSERWPDELVLRLDGRQVASLPTDGPPPWRTTIDVGSENRDRRLEAVARRGGVELARAARETPAVRIDERIDLGLRQLYVTVTDRRGARVRGLPRDAFTVREAGTSQPLVTFEAGGVPFTAMLLVDASSSMIGERLEAARRGVERFVADMGELDLARLAVFSDRLLALGEFSDDPATVAAPLGAGGSIGGTSLLDQLHHALLLLERRQGRRVALLLSDGWDTHSALDVAQVERLALRGSTQLFWLRPADTVPHGRWLGPPSPGQGRRAVSYSAWRTVDESIERYRALEALVEATGGRIVDFETDADLEPALIDILDELRSQYALGYYPSDAGADTADGWLSVDVEVEPSRLRVRAPSRVRADVSGSGR